MTFLYPLIVLLTAAAVCAVHVVAYRRIRSTLHGKYPLAFGVFSRSDTVTTGEQRDFRIDPRDISAIEAVRRRCTRMSVGLIFGGFGVMLLLSSLDPNAAHKPSCSGRYNPAAICGSK